MFEPAPELSRQISATQTPHPRGKLSGSGDSLVIHICDAQGERDSTSTDGLAAVI
jgi:hypothetical protein